MNKLTQWPKTLFARLLQLVKDTTWWQAHLKREDDKKWQQIRNKAVSLLTETEENQRKIHIQVIDNVINNLRTSATAYGHVDAGTFERSDFVARSSALYLNNLSPLSDIVGIQPMSAPTGLVYFLSYGLVDVPGVPSVFTTGDAQSPATKSMRMEVIRKSVEAKTRKLQTRFNIEVVQDLKAMFDKEVDATQELALVSTESVMHEVYSEVLADLINLADTSTTVETGDSAAINGARLGIAVSQAANEIARKTRRGPGNFIVCDPMTVSYLQTGLKSVFAPAPKGTSPGELSTMTFVGILNGTIKVYCLINENVEGKILVGYKGANGVLDTGYVLSPYIPLLTSGIVIDPETFQPIMTMMTRYGKTVLEATDAQFSDAKNYYAVIEVPPFEKMVPDSVDQSNTDPVQSDSTPTEGVDKETNQ